MIGSPMRDGSGPYRRPANGVLPGSSSPAMGGLPMSARSRMASTFATSPRALPEVILRSERRQLLGDGDIDELVQGDAFGRRHLAKLLQQRRLQAQREIALPHIRSSKAPTASPGEQTLKS
jgi:hypothetical protein